jgi:hypothetical protein
MMQFCWSIGNIDYPLQHVPARDIIKARKKLPNHLGIPYMYAMIDGEPEWWPDSMEGWPKVFLFSPL